MEKSKNNIELRYNVRSIRVHVHIFVDEKHVAQGSKQEADVIHLHGGLIKSSMCQVAPEKQLYAMGSHIWQVNPLVFLWKAAILLFRSDLEKSYTCCFRFEFESVQNSLPENLRQP